MAKQISKILFLCTSVTITILCQNNFVVITPDELPEQIIAKAATVVPSPRQYEWQKMEMTGFIHFGINTFDEVEWGQRTTDITKFNPGKIDVQQWVQVFKDAGFTLIILTCKHHDGFCLWPSKFTDYSIARTPFQSGNGDIVRDLSKACREAGMKFGIYLSPWDMHEQRYGTPEYNQHFVNQLTELLTNYGEIAEVWFDGANGEGPSGRRQVYDWQAYYQLIRKLQPNAVIAVSGPDVRWVGTESGYGRQTEWSVLPGTSTDQETIATNSQQQMMDGAFTPRDLMDEDLGSREKLKNAKSLIWYPAEIDVSIRPRWFYNHGDDELVKTPEKLVDIYFNSIGMNGVLLLNVPPDTRGVICEQDIKALHGMRYLLDETFKTNLVKDGMVAASNESQGNRAINIIDDDLKTCWTTDGNENRASIEVHLKHKQTFNCAMLQENILVGQRIEKFHLEHWSMNQWNKLIEGTTVGYKRLLRFPEVSTEKIKIVIDECRLNPTLASFGLYETPPEVKVQYAEDSFSDSVKVELTTDSPSSKIYYTLNEIIPTRNSTSYAAAFWLKKTTTVTSMAISKSGKKGLSSSKVFHKAKHGISYNIPYSNKYIGEGKYTLVDGVKGSDNFNDGRWQGCNGTDLDVVVDLGKDKQISKISSSFLRDINSFIFLPQSVEYSFSNNGKDFSHLKEVQNDIGQHAGKSLVKEFELQLKGTFARYVKVRAKNIGVCPLWHKGAGEKAWIFCDEINVE